MTIAIAFLTRLALVALFLPFSALDKLRDFGGAVTQARGSSIMVPSRNGTVICRSRKTSSATCRTMNACFRNSTTLAVRGIITSGITRPFRDATVQAASKIARTCIAVISG